MLKRYIGFVVAFFIGLASLGGWWIVGDQRKDDLGHEIARVKGESLFNLVQTTRQWNSQHGGVYVPVTEQTQPNPYLESPDRDVVDSLGRTLTKINPVYMTRQIAELLEGRDVTARLTSLDPLNPSNTPDGWEAEALQAFARGERLDSVTTQNEQYRYIAPLTVEASCLACHAHQGYQVGQVRGALSIRFPIQKIDVLVERVLSESTNLYWLVYALIAIFGACLYILTTAFVRKLNARADKERELMKKARYDGLTGVLNRQTVMEEGEYEYKRARRISRNFSVLLMDLDHFKSINDTHGHHAGDQVLKQVVKVMKANVRDVDFVGRYGGEEFIILLPNVDVDGAAVVADRIRAEVNETPILVDTPSGVKRLKVSLSAGVAERRQSYSEDLTTLIQQSDSALYDAKEAGRNRISVFGKPVLRLAG